jgi:hypothetical protein
MYRIVTHDHPVETLPGNLREGVLGSSVTATVLVADSDAGADAPPAPFDILGRRRASFRDAAEIVSAGRMRDEWLL